MFHWGSSRKCCYFSKRFRIQHGCPGLDWLRIFYFFSKIISDEVHMTCQKCSPTRSEEMLFLEKKLKMFRSIRGRGINNCFKKTQHFFRTPREIIVACLVTRHHAACIASEDENVKSLRHTDG
jgi:hypothetical protein